MLAHLPVFEQIDSDGLREPGVTAYFRHTNTQGIADFEYLAGESDWRPVGGHFGELSR